jgi:hypothetical protein
MASIIPPSELLGEVGSRNKRAANEGWLDERRNTHPRVHTSIVSLNDDCLVRIFSFLAIDEMNSLAECGSVFRTARSNESLGRNGTIRWTNNRSFGVFHRMLTRCHDKFTGKGNSLRVEGLGSSLNSRQRRGFTSLESSQLPNITSLDCSSHSVMPVRDRHNLTLLHILSITLPCLEVLNLSNIVAHEHDFTAHTVFQSFPRHCKLIQTLYWKNCRYLSLRGTEFRNLVHLTHVFLDGVVFTDKTATLQQVAHLDGVTVADTQSTSPVDEIALLMDCERLQSVCISGATLKSEGLDPVPLSQEVLLATVTYHKGSLRWIKADFTPETVAAINNMEPYIKCVSSLL